MRARDPERRPATILSPATFRRLDALGWTQSRVLLVCVVCGGGVVLIDPAGHPRHAWCGAPVEARPTPPEPPERYRVVFERKEIESGVTVEDDQGLFKSGEDLVQAILSKAEKPERAEVKRIEHLATGAVIWRAKGAQPWEAQP